MAELCLARSLSQTGESAVYYHLVTLCCRLRGDIKEALCHVQLGIKKYGDVSFLINFISIIPTPPPEVPSPRTVKLERIAPRGSRPEYFAFLRERVLTDRRTTVIL